MNKTQLFSPKAPSSLTDYLGCKFARETLLLRYFACAKCEECLTTLESTKRSTVRLRTTPVSKSDDGRHLHRNATNVQTQTVHFGEHNRRDLETLTVRENLRFSLSIVCVCQRTNITFALNKETLGNINSQEERNLTLTTNMAMVAPAENDFYCPPCSDDCKVDVEERRRNAVSNKPPCALAERCVSACAAYGKVCPCSARIAAHYACDAVAELLDHSDLFATEKEDYVYLNTDDLVIQEKLGEGGFSHVNRCTLKAGPEQGQEFAVKYLKRKAMVELHTFKHGAADLAIEARFLHQLDHPHIVKLHGVTAGSVENNFASGRECGFFIVVDKLDMTLEKRIEVWRKEREHDQTGLMGRLNGEYRERKREELYERLRIAYAIASAMEYLHSKGIVFRDLKPDNIGFDKVGAKGSSWSPPPFRII